MLFQRTSKGHNALQGLHKHNTIGGGVPSLIVPGQTHWSYSYLAMCASIVQMYRLTVISLVSHSLMTGLLMMALGSGYGLCNASLPLVRAAIAKSL